MYLTDVSAAYGIFRKSSDPLIEFCNAKYKKGYGRYYSRSIGTLCLLQNREGHIRRIQQK